MLLFVVIPFFADAQATFPESCLGSWYGTMYIYANGQVRDSVDVRFTAGQTEDPRVWSWKMEYLSQKQPQTKDYLLREEDKAKGVYVIDERDGIALTGYRFGTRLHFVFEVTENLLLSSYEWFGDTLIFEVASCKKAEGSDQPVRSFSVTNLQRVVLKRQ